MTAGRPGMSEAVRLTFRPGVPNEGTGGLPIREICDLAVSMGPEALRFELLSDPESGLRSSLDVHFGDETRGAHALVSQLKKVAARLEGELGFQASWFGEEQSLAPADWQFCELCVPTVALPSGKPVGAALRPAQAFPNLLELARLNGSACYICVELQAVSQDLDTARRLVPAMAELDGVPRHQAIQDGIAEVLALLKADGWVSFEIFGTPRAETALAGVVETTWRRHIGSQASFIPADVVKFQWRAEADVESETSSDEVFLRRGPDYPGEVFALLTDAAAERIAAPEVPRLLTARRIETGAAAQPFAFLSYAHRDAALMQRIAAALDASGIPYWYDSGIEPGSVWDETLERRIETCAAFIACVSDNYAASKYCRREMKFADGADRPIVPVSADLWLWSPGLKFMFQEIQIANLAAAGLEDFLASVARAMPEVET